jgi:hypothetical protein
MGIPPLQECALRDNGIHQKLRKLQTSWIDIMGKGWYGIFGYAREISPEDWEVAHIRMEERILPGAIVYASKKVAKERHLFQ